MRQDLVTNDLEVTSLLDSSARLLCRWIQMNEHVLKLEIQGSALSLHQYQVPHLAINSMHINQSGYLTLRAHGEEHMSLYVVHE